MPIHDSQLLIQLFNDTFSSDYKTCLVGGGEEPEYRPAGLSSDLHQVVFTHNYFASALHEVAHWCVAGEQRRLQVDYGYWYAPDGRDEQQQQAFERVEIKPQALEWLFSNACSLRFRVSADNIESGVLPSLQFLQAIVEQAHFFCREGVNPRAQRWIKILNDYFDTNDIFSTENYSLDVLQ